MIRTFSIIAVLLAGCAAKEPRYDEQGNLNLNAEQPLHLVGRITIGSQPKAKSFGFCSIIAVRP